MSYDCDIVANNNTDFIIAQNVKSGQVPVLIGGGENSFVDKMNFDFEECCQKNALFKTRYGATMASLKNLPLQDKFNAIQSFLEYTMPLCEKKNLDERTACVFDGEPFSYMVENKLCMCSERAAAAQYMCQQCGIKSYLVNSFVNIRGGEKGQHAYLMFEKNDQIFIYDPANPTKDNAPRIMETGMDTIIFNDFIAAVNENADSPNKRAKNMVGFVCSHKDGKQFLYHSNCGTKDKIVGPKVLKEARASKLNSPQTFREL